MTYCLSLQCHDGLVFLSDSRTSAGVDNVTIHSKMRVYETARATRLLSDELRQSFHHPIGDLAH